MTLEELRFRIAVAFPTSRMTARDMTGWAKFDLDAPLDLGAGERPVVAFEVWDSDGDVEAIPHFEGEDEHTISHGAHAEKEILRRIHSITAHQIVAARRRLAQEALS